MPISSAGQIGRLALGTLLLLGCADAALALDRKPFNGGDVSDARPGYGAASPGYGAERQYYGAERGAARRGDVHTGDRSSFLRFDDDGRSFGEPGDGGFVSPLGVDDARAGIYPGFETGSGSFLYLDGENGEAPIRPERRSSVMHVEEARLVARPIGPSGIAVDHVGATRIIRIAPEADGAREASAGSRPQAGPTGLVPWSAGWARYCSRAHASFDPAAGTFTDADGAVRFCTGD